MRSIKLPYIPNVTDVRFVYKNLDLAALTFGIQRQESRMITEDKTETIEKLNAYLRRSYHRLGLYAKRGQLPQFLKLARILLRESIAYRLAIMHRADPKYLSSSEEKAMKKVRKVGKMAHSMDWNLQYKRVWIEKKPGDYSRPLGVPKPDWRIWTKMTLHVMEIFFRCSGVIQPWQHAGISKRGLVSAWKEIINKVRGYEYIYEFDIKGFFDRVRNQDVLSKMGKEWNEWCNKLVNVKPFKYVLPPEEQTKDKRTSFEIIRDKYADLRRMRYEKFMQICRQDAADAWKRVMNQPGGLLDNPESYGAAYELLLSSVIEYNADLIGKERLKALLTEDRPFDDGDSAALIAEAYLMTQQKFDFAISEAEIVEARESWKGLGEKDRGFPQGLNISPFLSCLVLHQTIGKRLPKGLLMYMDDGIIYGRTEREALSRLERFKGFLAEAGLELNESKSGWAKRPDIECNLKFLGIRMKGPILMSETRNGTMQFIPQTIDEETLSMILNSGLLTISEQRIASWLHKQARDQKEAYKWAIQKGFFASLIDKAFNPKKEEQDKKIRIGKEQARQEILKSKGMLARELARVDATHSNLSTFATMRLLKLIRRARRKRQASR